MKSNMATATGSLSRTGFSRLPFITKDELRTIEYIIEIQLRDAAQRQSFIDQYNNPNNNLNQRHMTMIGNALSPNWLLATPVYDELTFIEIQSLGYQRNVNH